jgi:hypothetical protein
LAAFLVFLTELPDEVSEGPIYVLSLSLHVPLEREIPVQHFLIGIDSLPDVFCTVLDQVTVNVYDLTLFRTPVCSAVRAGGLLSRLLKNVLTST